MQRNASYRAKKMDPESQEKIQANYSLPGSGCVSANGSWIAGGGTEKYSTVEVHSLVYTCILSRRLFFNTNLITHLLQIVFQKQDGN